MTIYLVFVAIVMGPWNTPMPLVLKLPVLFETMADCEAWREKPDPYEFDQGALRVLKVGFACEQREAKTTDGDKPA